MNDAHAQLVADPDLSGRRLGDYQLLRRLGRGAMADVYLAQQESLRRQVAFKTLKSQLALDETYVKRFHLEAQAAASLVHANIVQIHDVGYIDSIHFIAQEYVQGVNLREYVTRHGPPDAKLAVRVMRQVTAALSRAAEQGIVHRDIKPENIMLAKTGEVKVADFGLARTMREGASLDLTQIGVTMGTPLYMSPEQVEGRPLDPRSDIYSFGVTCYYMLSGQAPFRGDTALSVALQHLNAQPPRLETLRPDLPAGLCRIVHQMLAKDPDARYRSPRDMLKELRALEIEGIESDEDESHWTAGETVPVSNLRLEATQQLGTLMQTQSLLLRPARHWPKVVTACAVVAFIAGVAIAYATRPEYVLADAQPTASTVRKMETPELQYRYAQMVQTPEAWQAVIDHSGNHRYVPLAQEELAWQYFLDRDNERARKLFQDLERYSDLDRRFRAFGLAGSALLLSREGRKDESAYKLTQLFELTGGTDPRAFQNVFGDFPSSAERFIMEAVATLVTRNNSELSSAARQEWEAIRDSLVPSDGVEPEGPVDNGNDP